MSAPETWFWFSEVKIGRFTPQDCRLFFSTVCVESLVSNDIFHQESGQSQERTAQGLKGPGYRTTTCDFMTCYIC